MKKQEIITSLKELPDVTIEQETDEYICVFDEKDSKSITYYFNETETEQTLSERVIISNRIPKEFAQLFDKNHIVKTIYEKIKHISLLTLEQLRIIYDEDDLQELYNETGDEYALFLFDRDDEPVGITWFERNICLLNANTIIENSKEMATDIYGEIADNYIENLIREGLWTTLIHELRHLMLDTNIILPEDQYPISLASEENVEAYCRDYYEQHFLQTR